MMRRRRTRFLAAASALLLVGAGGAAWVVKSRGIPFVGKCQVWSIGIYEGPSPLKLRPSERARNPVLTAQQVTDVRAEFVADPFLVRDARGWYMFLEVMNLATNQGDIGLATSSDGLVWQYKQIVLDEPFHLSYPQVFAWGGEHYMVPESWQTHSVRLYQARNFPLKWSFVKTLIEGEDYVDPSIIRHEETWWLFVSTTGCNVLRLFWSKELAGPWVEHPRSPVIQGRADIARPAGRVVRFGEHLYRYAQDDREVYGRCVRAFRITELTLTAYAEQAAADGPILAGSGSGWNRDGMHHVDAHAIDGGRWLACVDGWARGWRFGLDY